MTILDYDKREKSCPVCKEARLIFITDAPKIRPEGKTVLYRCKDCATKEAETAGDPLVVLSHPERSYLSGAWRRDQRATPKVPITSQQTSKVTRAATPSDAIQGGGRRNPHPAPRKPVESTPRGDRQPVRPTLPSGEVRTWSFDAEAPALPLEVGG